MLKSELLRAIQQEIQRHDFSHFVENPLAVAQGGKGVVVPGCPARGLNREAHFYFNKVGPGIQNPSLHLKNGATPALPCSTLSSPAPCP